MKTVTTHKIRTQQCRHSPEHYVSEDSTIGLYGETIRLTMYYISDESNQVQKAKFDNALSSSTIHMI